MCSQRIAKLSRRARPAQGPGCRFTKPYRANPTSPVGSLGAMACKTATSLVPFPRHRQYAVNRDQPLQPTPLESQPDRLPLSSHDPESRLMVCVRACDKGGGGRHLLRLARSLSPIQHQRPCPLPITCLLNVCPHACSHNGLPWYPITYPSRGPQRM